MLRSLRSLISKNQLLVLHIAALISGILAGGVFSFNWTWLLIPLALMALLYVLRQEKSDSKRWYILANFFFVFHCIVLVWFLDVNVSDLISTSHSVSVVVAWLCWWLMAAVLTLPMLVAGLALSKTLKTRSIILPALIASSIWVVCEYVRSLLFSIFLYGKQGTIGDYWNFGSLGLGLMSSPLSYLSSTIGLYGLTLLAVLVSILTYRSVVRKKYLLAGFCFFAVVFLGAIVNLPRDPPARLPEIQASVMQQETPFPDMDNTVIENYSSSLKDLIVLPEYSHVFTPERYDVASGFVNKRLGTKGTSIDVARSTGDRWYGTLVFRDKKGQIVAQQTKQFLIPTGEYIPWIFHTYYSLAGQEHILSSFARNRQVYKGEPPAVYKAESFNIGPVACSGILGRNIYRQLTYDGANVLTNSASLADFNYSRAYFRQSMQMARFHAIANSRTFIQASLGASAFVLNNQGEFIVEPSNERRTKFVDFGFVPNTNRTFYTKYGEWPLFFSAFFLAVFATFQVIRKRYKR